MANLSPVIYLSKLFWGFLLLIIFSQSFAETFLKSSVAGIPLNDGDPRTYAPDIRRWTNEEESQELFFLKTARDQMSAGNYQEADKSWAAAIGIAESTWGSHHPFTAALLVSFAQADEESKRYQEAELLFSRALGIRESRLGANNLHTVNCLEHLALVVHLQGRASEAESLYRRVVAWRDRPDANQIELATSINNLAHILYEQNRYRDAEVLFRRALEITEANVGPNSDETALSLENLAESLKAQGQDLDAQIFQRRADVIRNKTTKLISAQVQADHEAAKSQPSTANRTTIPPDIRPITTQEQNTIDFLYHMLTKDYESRSEYKNAEKILRKEVQILEASWGPKHPVTAVALTFLANNLIHQGRYVESESINRSVVAIRTSRLGPREIDTGKSYSNLASSVSLQGKYSDAENLERQALAIFESHGEKSELEVAFSLNNLAYIINYQGRLSEGEFLLRRALSMTELIRGSNDSQTANSLNNLAFVLDAQGKFSEAEPYYRRALYIQQSFPEKQVEIALCLDNVGVNLVLQNRSSEGEAYHREALRILEWTLGKEHPVTATTLNNLAENFRAQGFAIKARKILMNVLRINKKKLGPDHPNTVSALENLARADLQLSFYQEALENASAAMRIRQTGQGRIGKSVPEATKKAGSNSIAVPATIFVKAAWSRSKQQPKLTTSLREKAFEAAQSIRISSSSEAAAQGSAKAVAETAGAASLVMEWRTNLDAVGQIDAQVSAALSQGAAGDAARAALFRQRLVAVERVKLSEDRLKNEFPRYFDLIRQQAISVKDLQAKFGYTADLLQNDEALVLLNPGDARFPKSNANGFVFVVTKTKVAWAEIPYSPSELQRRIRALHNQLADGGPTNVAMEEETAEGFNRAAAFELYGALFDAPEIRQALIGKERWILVPQGSLLSLPFSALVSAPPLGGRKGDGDVNSLRATKWLGLTKTLTLVPSVSSLRMQRIISHEKKITIERMPFFGLGNPAFSGKSDDENCVADDSRGPLKSMKAYIRGSTAVADALRKLKCLPESGPEIVSIAERLNAGRDTYVLQLDATEKEVRQRNADGRLKRANVIAFATHGLVSGDLGDSQAEPALAVTPPDLPRNEIVQDENDGLLTASEIATFDLSAQIVILSACNTAAGETDTPDGLSGLARAFFYAGAETIMVSHFPVFDDSAMRLTTSTIKYSGERIKRPEALRKAMLDLSQDRSMDMTGYSYAHPSRWAPFAVIDAN